MLLGHFAGPRVGLEAIAVSGGRGRARSIEITRCARSAWLAWGADGSEGSPARSARTLATEPMTRCRVPRDAQPHDIAGASWAARRGDRDRPPPSSRRARRRRSPTATRSERIAEALANAGRWARPAGRFAGVGVEPGCRRVRGRVGDAACSRSDRRRRARGEPPRLAADQRHNAPDPQLESPRRGPCRRIRALAWRRRRRSPGRRPGWTLVRRAEGWALTAPGLDTPRVGRSRGRCPRASGTAGDLERAAA
jgi:hypothetical protein